MKTNKKKFEREKNNETRRVEIPEMDSGKRFKNNSSLCLMRYCFSFFGYLKEREKGR